MITSLDELNCSTLIFGTMRIGAWGANMNSEQILHTIERCLEMGITTFDLADIYGDYSTEADFGKALALKPALRKQMQLITKYGIRMVCDARPEHHIKSYDASGEHMIASVENSLRVLQTDHIDVLLIHRPDILLHPDEVAEAFTKLEKAGKVRALGVSNFTPAQFDLLHSRIPLVTNQVEVSLMHRDCFIDGTLDQCLKHNIRPQAWSPVAGGSIFSQIEDVNVQRIHRVAKPLCEKYGLALDQLLFAWLLKHPSRIMPVIGTTKIKRVEAAVEAQKVTISRVDWYDLWQAATGNTIA